MTFLVCIPLYKWYWSWAKVPGNSSWLVSKLNDLRVSNYLQSWTYLPLSSLAKIGELILAVYKKRQGKCASLYPDYVCLSVAFVFIIKAEIKTTVMLWMHKEIQRKHCFVLVHNRKKELAGFSGQEVQYACRCAKLIPWALTSGWI